MFWKRKGNETIRTYQFEKIEIGKLNLMPGDVIILKTKRALPKEAINNIDQSIKKIFPNNICFVLEEGIDLVIIRPGNENG